MCHKHSEHDQVHYQEGRHHGYACKGEPSVPCECKSQWHPKLGRIGDSPWNYQRLPALSLSLRNRGKRCQKLQQINRKASLFSPRFSRVSTTWSTVMTSVGLDITELALFTLIDLDLVDPDASEEFKKGLVMSTGKK